MSAKQITRRMMRRWAISAVTLALSVTPTLTVAADSCRDLAFQRASLKDQAQSIKHDNPGSVTVFVGCFLAGNGSYEKDKNGPEALVKFGLCTAAACNATHDYENCLSVNAGLFAMTLQDQDLENQMRALPGCPV